ncbi:acyltransferase family protein [uncultured Amphritea sp.]|uniref:acyltransferase family protein n=1 Tax=uncultured Amphritea sp. TaxID=981605 RepID=UPI00261FE58F|nr:acyltransferase family protein [uncultured Amphritea sp.]
MSNDLSYRPDVDGLRALAVIPVVLFHAGLTVFSGGFVGVDVFFVISGYVITRSLLKNLEEGGFSISDFYYRRIRRIFPALFFSFFLTWIAAWWFLLPPFFEKFSASMASSALFVSNIYFWKTISYFNAQSDLMPLLHTWSLSVEEQYYIFMPIAMWVIFKYIHRYWNLCLWPIIIISFILSCYLIDKAPSANFYLLPTRAWELLLGAIVAVNPRLVVERKWGKNLLGSLGLILIVGTVFLYEKTMPFPGYGALAPCLGAVFIIVAGRGVASEGSFPFAYRLLSYKPVVFFGLISYSLYLVHWPVIVFMKYDRLVPLNYTDMLMVVIASVLLAMFSWRFIEQPFRSTKIKNKTVVFMPASLLIVISVGFGYWGFTNGGFDERYPDFSSRASFEDVSKSKRNCFLMDAKNYQHWDADKCKLSEGDDKNENVLLWGDSFAAHYAPGFESLSSDLPFDLYQYTSAGCPPILSFESFALPYCDEFNQNALKIIKEKNIAAVILSARWTDYKSRGFMAIKSTLDWLENNGIDYVLIGQSPQYVMDVSILEYRKGRGDSNSVWNVFYDEKINDELKSVIGVGAFYNPMDVWCQGVICQYEFEGVLLHSDYGHYSKEGAKLSVRPLLTYLHKRY